MAKRKENDKDLIYRYYITDALMVIAENTQRINGGRAMKRRYAEAIKPPTPKDELPNGKQIAGDLIARISKVK